MARQHSTATRASAPLGDTSLTHVGAIPRWWRVAPALLYLAVTLIFVWPLPRQLGSATVSADSPDIWIHLWWMWQVRESILGGQNPYETFRVFHPTGAPLYLMGQDMLTALLSVPLQGLLGLVLTYNLLTIAGMTFGAWAMYLLALDVTGSRPGALIAGLVFGFAPLQAAFLNLGQMEYVNIGFLPLALLFLLRLRRAGPWHAPLVGGACALLTLLSSWYQALFLLLVAALFAAYELARLALARRWRPACALVVRLLAWGLTLVILASPILIPTLRLAATSKFAVTPLFNITYSSIDVLDPLRPDRLNPLFGASRATLTTALGYVATALSILGLWRARRRGRFWALLIVVFYLLALGPYLKFAGRLEYLPFLPYNLLYRLPLGNIARVPSRFLILITIAQAILAAYAVAWLRDWLARRLPQRALVARVAATALIALLILAEVFPAPRALAQTAVDPLYERLRFGPPGALYELPYDDRALAMYRATVHKRPLIGGYISRPVPYPLLNGVPVITDLRNRPDSLLGDLAGPDIVEQTAPIERAVALFDTYNLRYIVLRRDANIAPDQLAALAVALERLLPTTLIVYDDASSRVYQIPHAPRSGIVTGFGGGWYALERRADTGGRFRWANQEVALPVTLLDDAPQIATLTATIFSYSRPATVDVFLGETLLTTISATAAPQQLTVAVPLVHGYNGLRLRAREVPLSPNAINGPAARDARLLSFALADVRIAAP